MKCPMCDQIELTEIEANEKTMCLRCALMIKAKQDQIGVQAPPINHIDFGRTLDEKKEFEKFVMEKMGAFSGKKQTKNKKSLGLDIFDGGVEMREIVVHGANEDVELKLTLPIIYHIPEKHFKETEAMLQEFLKIILHTLAFGPLDNTNVEEFLIRKFGLVKKKEDL